MDKRVVENKANLVSPIVRHRIQDSLFYKQHLHLTNELTIVPVVVDFVQYVGGTDEGGRPAPFLCCLLRLLELQPSDEIINIYLTQNGYNEFKYLTAMALLYCRIVADAHTVYRLHDQYILDYRKLRVQRKVPRFVNDQPVHFDLEFMDSWVHWLVLRELVVDVTLPYLGPRSVYGVAPRVFVESEGEESEYVSDSD